MKHRQLPKQQECCGGGPRPHQRHRVDSRASLAARLERKHERAAASV